MPSKRRFHKQISWLVGLLLLSLAACSQNTAVTNPLPTLDSALIAPQPAPTAAAQELALTRPFGNTYAQPNGNRLVAGSGNLPGLTPLDIPLDGMPKWVTAVPLAKGVLWGVILDDGRTQTFLVDTGEVTAIESNELPAGVPRIMTVDPQQGQAIFLNPPAVDPSSQNPIIYNQSGHMAFSLASGALSLVDENGQPLPAPALTLLPDARILFADNGRLLFLSDPTDRYPHAVLGDSFEAGSITLLDTVPEVRLAAQIPIADPQVVEGIMPLWLDWDGDGRREIIVTLSDDNQGAQINLFSETGERLAQGPAIGQGGRWRHQIALAPFGPNGEQELVGVLTPHIGGVVEFYQWQGDQLVIVAQLPGYTSHIIGSNNVDMAVAGDFNGDGRAELLLPTQDRSQLGGIQRTTDGAEAIYQLDIGGNVITNLAGVTVSGEEGGESGTAVGLGRSDNTLRIWQP